MKKVVMMIIGIIAVLLILNNSVADGYSETYDNLVSYAQEQNIYEYYNRHVDIYGIYGAIGTMSINTFQEEVGDGYDWDHPEAWFTAWYDEMLMEAYPEYGQLGSFITKIGEKNGTVVYHLTVVAENDIIDWIDGNQKIVDMLIGFYEE